VSYVPEPAATARGNGDVLVFSAPEVHLRSQVAVVDDRLQVFAGVDETVDVATGVAEPSGH
jgi:hypothetical protein